MFLSLWALLGYSRHHGNSLVANRREAQHVNCCTCAKSDTPKSLYEYVHADTQTQGLACTLTHRIMMWKWEIHYMKGFIIFTQYKLESAPFSVHKVWHRCIHKHSCCSFSTLKAGDVIGVVAEPQLILLWSTHTAQPGSSCAWEGCALTQFQLALTILKYGTCQLSQ